MVEGQITYARALHEQSVWLKRLAKRQDAVEQRLDKVEQRLDGMDLRLQSVEARLESLETQSAKTLQLLTLALDDLSFIKQILKPGGMTGARCLPGQQLSPDTRYWAPGQFPAGGVMQSGTLASDMTKRLPQRSPLC